MHQKQPPAKYAFFVSVPNKLRLTKKILKIRIIFFIKKDDILNIMKNDDHIVIDENKDLKNNICEECKKEDESVKQNLIMHGFKFCNSCKLSKTIFPI